MKYTAASVWNRVPDFIQKLTSIQSFKSNYKSYLIDQYTGPPNRQPNGRLNASNRRNIRNNNHGQLTDDRRVRFQSRWDEGPNQLV